MNGWIRWCKCERYILTTDQMRNNLPCQRCQDEAHAKSFHKEFDIKKEEEKDDTGKVA